MIAGSAGGLRLDVPAGNEVRPTGDRVKEALFSTLGDLTDQVVLDLYAGSGALGIEALSRGAARAVFVERDRRAVAIIRGNLQRTGFTGRARVVGSSVSRFCRTPTGGPFQLVVADPPYAVPLGEFVEDLRHLAAGSALPPGARVVIERDRRRPEAPPRLLGHVQDRTYGDTMLRYFVYEPDHPHEEHA